MLSLKPFVWLAAGIVEANVLPRQTAFANGTITASSSSVKPTRTPSTTDAATLTATTTSGNECAHVKGVCYVCGGIADGISLNSWWTSSYDLTVGECLQKQEAVYV